MVHSACLILPGRRTRTMTTRVSKELERPRRFHRNSGSGDRNRQLPGPRWDAHDEGEKPRAKRWYRLVEHSKRVETGGGVRSVPIVSTNGGTHPRDPVEKRGCHVMTPLEGNTAGASKPVDVSTKQQRIAESGTRRSADSLREPSRSECMI